MSLHYRGSAGNWPLVSQAGFDGKGNEEVVGLGAADRGIGGGETFWQKPGMSSVRAF
jgi:hypothetical protein